MNEFAPDFYEFTILDELLKLTENNKEGTTYSLLFNKVSKSRKERYKLETLPGTFSKKIKELLANKYLSILRSHPKTFINIVNPEVKTLVDSYFKIRKDSQIKTAIEKSGEIRRELIEL